MHTRGSVPLTCITELRVVLSRNTWPLRPLTRRSARQLERERQEQNQRLAGRVQEILAGRGLTQQYYSIGGGRGWHITQVVSVVDGPPVGLIIRTLPGQTPDDFVAHTSAIAYNLGVADVQVVPLGPSLIRLELLLPEQVERHRATAEQLTPNLPDLNGKIVKIPG